MNTPPTPTRGAKFREAETQRVSRVRLLAEARRKARQRKDADTTRGRKADRRSLANTSLKDVIP